MIASREYWTIAASWAAMSTVGTNRVDIRAPSGSISPARVAASAQTWDTTCQRRFRRRSWVRRPLISFGTKPRKSLHLVRKLYGHGSTTGKRGRRSAQDNFFRETANHHSERAGVEH